MTKKVLHLYSTNNTLRRYVRDTFSTSQWRVVEHCGPEGAKRRANVHEVNSDSFFIPLPVRADVVLSKGSLNLKTEYLAARLGALAVVVPEAEDWLASRLDQVDGLVVVGADQAK